MHVRRSTELALVAMVVLAGAVVFTWPLAANLSRQVPAPGDSLPNAWVLGWVADRTAHGLRGVWNAPILYPYLNTLAFGEPLFGVAVPLAPLYWFSGSALLVHNIAVLASFVIAGTGGYVLGRDLTRQRAAGALSGTVAAFLAYRVGHLSHVQVLMSAWLWWLVWAVHSYFERPTLVASLRVALFFVLLGLSSLYWLYAGAIAAGIIIAIEVWHRRRPVLAWLWHGTAAGALCAAAFAPVALQLRAITTATAPIETVDTKSYSADVMAFVSGQPTLKIWGRILGRGNGESDLFPGLGVLVFASIALFWHRRSHHSHAADQSARTHGWTWPYAGLVLIGAVLALGSRPTLAGQPLFSNPAFGWLAAVVPGFAQLRATARFIVIAHLGLSILAAHGLAAWLRRRPGRAGGVTAAVACAMVFLEGLAAPVDVIAFRPEQRAGDREAAAWLSSQPPGAVIELPLDGWGRRAHATMEYQFHVLRHGHPSVTGVSRFSPPLSAMLADPDSPLIAPDRVPGGAAFLRRLGVRYVVIHPAAFFDYDLGERLRTAFGSASVGRPHPFGESTVIDLGDVTDEPVSAPVTELPASSLTLDATSGLAARMIDGDPATRWLTGAPQSGGERVTVSLAVEQPIAGVRLQLLGRSFNDYPRGLSISVVAGDGQVVEVFSGSVLPAFGAALRFNPAAPVIELRWPPVRGRQMQLLQTGRTSRIWFWSIHELRVLRPAA